MHAVVKGCVFREGNLRGVINLESLPELAADEAAALVQRIERCFLLFRFSEKADVNGRFAQIARHFDFGHRDKADARVFQIMKEHLAHFLLDKFLYFAYS